ncbi:MAG: hypothetical protein ABIH25_00615 [Candidatus Woesearchaeota archaeon]
MVTKEDIRDYKVFNLFIIYRYSGVDPAIAELHQKRYYVLEKNFDAAVEKGTKQFESEFSEKIIDSHICVPVVSLEECLF